MSIGKILDARTGKCIKLNISKKTGSKKINLNLNIYLVSLDILKH